MTTPTTENSTAKERPRSRLQQDFQWARKVGTPLFGVQTGDPQATVEALCGAGSPTTPRFWWECIRGLTPIGAHSAEALAKLDVDREETVNPLVTLELCLRLPARSVVFFQNAHRYLAEREIAQAVWNLRDAFKNDLKSLVLIAPALTLPPELASDVVTLDDPLPGEDLLAHAVEDTAQRAGVGVTPEQARRAVDAVRGLTSFAAEQSLAMSVDPEAGRYDLDRLWQRKKATVENTPGLKITMHGPSFSEIGGLDNIKTFTERLFHGPNPPTCVVRIDEIEKAMGGSTGDTSGVSQDQLGVLLREMEDNNWRGLLALGFPGTGKSLLSKAMGTLGDVPTLEVDLGAAKGSLVGESEQKIRAMMRVVKAIAGEGAFFIGTCNRLKDESGRDLIVPELIRRFPFGKWFFDLPTPEERASIWDLYVGRFGVKGWAADAHPVCVDDAGWTGAEVRTCCEIAHRLACPLDEAASYIVPFALSEKEQVERLRGLADGRLLSASAKGPYRRPVERARPPGRSFATAEDV